MRTANRRGAAARIQPQDDLAVLLLDAAGAGIEDKADAFTLQGLLQLMRNIRVLARQDVLVAMDDRHAAAEAAEHLSEFQADVPAAEHQQMLGEFAQL